MNIGIIGIAGHSGAFGGAQVHEINIMNELKKYFNLVYFTDAAGVKATNFSGVKYVIINDYKNYDHIVQSILAENLDILFTIEIANYNNMIFHLSKKIDIKVGACLQALGDFNIHFSGFITNALKLLKYEKDWKLIPYMFYHYINRHIILHRISKHLDFALIVNNDYFKNFNLRIKNAYVLNPGNGISIDNFHTLKKNKENKIIYFARLYYMKGLIEVLYAFREILKTYDTKLVIAGNLIYENEKKVFLKYANKWGLSSRITYKGFLKTEELYEEISTSRLMLYPSHSDSFSIAISEALAFGTPVVAYDIPGLNIYKNLKAVKLVKEFDYKTMALEATKILNMPHTEDLFDKNIKDFIEEHTWKNVALEYKKVFDKMKNSN